MSGLVQGLAVVAVLAGVGATAFGLNERRRVRRLAHTATAALTTTGRRAPTGQATGAGGRLASAIEALAAASARDRDELDRHVAWRGLLIESLVDPALLFSARGQLLAANEAAGRLFSISDVTGLSVVQVLGGGSLAMTVGEVRDGTPGADGDEPVVIEVDHGAHQLRAVIRRVGDETLLLVTDLTRERAVQELRRNFVVNASHELKTPVTAIQTLGEALSVTLERDPARAVPLTRRLRHETERLARLVYDLLDLRRLEERGPLETEAVDLAELTRQVVVGALDAAAERDVRLSLEAPDRAPMTGVPGDLRVVVENLIGNAIQYNRPGGAINVSISAEDGYRVLRVSDTGIGIPQQDLNQIFERFYRVDTARSRQTGGTGLGLSIVRHAVERHGGTIRVTSKLGDGTTFVVSLPEEPPHSAAAAPRSAQEARRGSSA